MSDQIYQSNYTPEFQLEVFGLNPKTAMEPVLDVSCGQDPQLIHYLRMEGLNAYGADFDAPEDISYIKRASWTNSNFGHNKWGTILSNIDVANTINQAIKDGDEALKGLSLAYFNLLGCLKLHGKFIYAPPIPVLEEQIPKEIFRVVHEPITEDLDRTVVTKIAELD